MLFQFCLKIIDVVNDVMGRGTHININTNTEKNYYFISKIIIGKWLLYLVVMCGAANSGVLGSIPG